LTKDKEIPLNINILQQKAAVAVEARTSRQVPTQVGGRRMIEATTLIRNSSRADGIGPGEKWLQTRPAAI